MSTTYERFRALEAVAALHGLTIGYAAAKQNGRCCWFIATLNMLRARGWRLSADFSVPGLRAKSRDWLLPRAGDYQLFGEDYWSFVNSCQSAVVTNLVVIAALSVLGEELGVDLEMVALCTTGSDYLKPLRSTPPRPLWPDADQLVYGFDPERHYVAMPPKAMPLRQNYRAGVAAPGQVVAHTFEPLRTSLPSALPSLVPITDR